MAIIYKGKTYTGPDQVFVGILVETIKTLETKVDVLTQQLKEKK